MAISRIESETATQPLSNHLKGQRGSLAAADAHRNDASGLLFHASQRSHHPIDHLAQSPRYLRSGGPPSALTGRQAFFRPASSTFNNILKRLTRARGKAASSIRKAPFPVGMNHIARPRLPQRREVGDGAPTLFKEGEAK